VGVTATSSQSFLKALDLGGRDQRQIETLLEKGDKDGADKLLVGNKKGDSSRAFILTGGPLEKRQRAAGILQESFPQYLFVAIHPEAEGRSTLQSASTELQRLALSSGGSITHVLLVAKGSTDIHLAWLSATRGVATAAGTASSEVHQLEKSAPSDARTIFLKFMSAPVNAELAQAAQAGTCAVAFAGSSVHAIGRQFAATGNYFRRLSKAELAMSEASAAAFERFVGLEWLGGQTRVFLGSVVYKPAVVV